jgi:PilZ domain
MQVGLAVAIAERRGSSRREIAWPVQLLRNEGERCDAMCTDIGVSGVGFQTQAILRAGERIELVFPGAVTDGAALMPTVRAQIIYRIGDQYGASFLSGSD